MIKIPCNIPVHICEEIIRFTHYLCKETISSNLKVILFGSFQNGNFHTWSDIDIAVIADWQTDDIHERISYLEDISITEKCNRIQPVGFTKKELIDNKNNDFNKKIINGLLIYERNIE